jgi:hypothetical protein
VVKGGENMSPRLKEIDRRGFETMLLDAPDCDGRWEMADGSSVAVYMNGVNPAIDQRDLGIEFTNIQPGEMVMFKLDHAGESTRTLLDSRGNERVIKVELQQPLFVRSQATGQENVMVPNVKYVPGVV